MTGAVSDGLAARVLLMRFGSLSCESPGRTRVGVTPELSESSRNSVSWCRDRMVPLGERHVRYAIEEYVEHYHFERTHQGLGNQLIDGVPESRAGPVRRRERLGGLLSSYYREAA